MEQDYDCFDFCLEGNDHVWEDEWQDMPEYIQHDREAVKRVVVNFETQTDVELFNKITGLKISDKTKGVFFPPAKNKKGVYVKS